MLKTSGILLRAFRIFLLLIIIIGIVLIFTQDIWVPKLVAKLLGPSPFPIIIPTRESNLVLKPGRQCYSYSHDANSDAPYTVNEFMQITVTGTKVAGTKRGLQSGPNMNNGYEGTITGTTDLSTINVVFSYTVEGSRNQEKEIYRTSKIGIEKLRYPLIEKRGILVPDTTKDFQVLLYPRVGCGVLN